VATLGAWDLSLPQGVLAQSQPGGEGAAGRDERVKILSIEVRGTTRKESVLLAMDTKAGDRVTRAQIQQDLQRVLSLGWFLDVHASRVAGPGGDHLVIEAVENPKLTSVTFTGNTVFSEGELKAVFADQLGETANNQGLQEAREKIRALYEAKGYTLGRVADAQLSPAGELAVTITEGRIEDVKVAGNRETKDYVILREVTQKPGDLFNIETMRADLRRVSNTNFFEDIGLRLEPGEGGKVVVIVDVKEKQTGSVNMGAGFNTQQGLVGIFQISKDNLFGNGQKAGLDLQVGWPTIMGRVDWSDPWILPGRTSIGASLYRQRLSPFFTPYLDDRTGLSLTVGRALFGDPVTSPWRGSVSLRGERIGMYDPRTGLPSPGMTVTGTGTDYLMQLTGTLSYDTRDLVMNPHDGWYSTLSLTPAVGNATFVKSTGMVNRYFGITKDLTLALGGRFGTLFGGTPIYERFFGAGLDVIRGWPEDGSLQGNNMFISSAELRFPIYDPLAGVAFFDLGTFWSQKPLPWLEDFRYGFGLGVRLNTPLGALRIDYGIRNLSPFAGQFHFNIGQKF
jgi:outer membrane protein insertion porin family